MFTTILPEEPDRPKPLYRSTSPRSATACVQSVTGDSRCPILRQIDDALVALRSQHRRAIRILDVGCNEGVWLICAALHARRLGFVAIEGRGLDVAPIRVAQARLTAAAIRDMRIGLAFDVADIASALGEEDDRGVDIVLFHYGLFTSLPLADHDRLAGELARVTGNTLICVGGAQ
jgi:SAM-dependent methyltransferase